MNFDHSNQFNKKHGKKKKKHGRKKLNKGINQPNRNPKIYPIMSVINGKKGKSWTTNLNGNRFNRGKTRATKIQ